MDLAVRRKLTIDRQRWIRGQPGSQLLIDEPGITEIDSPAIPPGRNHGKMCCLGFAALELGYTPDEIRNRPSPKSVVDGGHKDLFTLARLTEPYVEHPDFVNNTNTCQTLMFTNDRTDISNAEREATLVRIFAELGIDVEFIN